VYGFEATICPNALNWRPMYVPGAKVRTAGGSYSSTWSGGGGGGGSPSTVPADSWIQYPSHTPVVM
jgi:hypothetical protein